MSIYKKCRMCKKIYKKASSNVRELHIWSIFVHSTAKFDIWFGKEKKNYKALTQSYKIQVQKIVKLWACKFLIETKFFQHLNPHKVPIQMNTSKWKCQ